MLQRVVAVNSTVTVICEFWTRRLIRRLRTAKSIQRREAHTYLHKFKTAQEQALFYFKNETRPLGILHDYTVHVTQIWHFLEAELVNKRCKNRKFSASPGPPLINQRVRILWGTNVWTWILLTQTEDRYQLTTRGLTSLQIFFTDPKRVPRHYLTEVCHGYYLIYFTSLLMERKHYATQIMQDRLTQLQLWLLPRHSGWKIWTWRRVSDYAEDDILKDRRQMCRSLKSNEPRLERRSSAWSQNAVCTYNLLRVPTTGSTSA